MHHLPRRLLPLHLLRFHLQISAALDLVQLLRILLGRVEPAREALVERGDASRQQDGGVTYRRNLIAALQEREVASAGATLATKKAIPFRAAAEGETVSGTFSGTVQLSSGKFAVVEKSYEFTLVPWRPVIDRQLGREVTGFKQGSSVSWQLGRQKGLGI